MPTLSAAPIRRAWTIVLDILYPPRCGGCDKRGTLLCDDCAASISHETQQPHSIPRLNALIYGGLFGGPLRAAIHKLKYESDSPLARPLALLISNALANDPSWVSEDGTPPTIIPVPLHPSKKRARGYNQAELIAEELTRITGWELNHNLIRTKNTQSQVGLHAEDRAENVRDAFEWQGDNPPLRVLLIDDVCTTGATLSECAFALISKGTNEIYAATAAKAFGIGPHSDS